MKFRDMKFRFDGPEYRVQLVVYDYDGAAVPHPTMFGVFVIHQTFPKTTPFVRGCLEYHGGDAATAWRAVLRLAPKSEVPRRLRKYVTGTDE